MHYHHALPIAQALLEQLRPHCQRLDIAGSLRRRMAEVKDIEIVAVPIVADNNASYPSGDLFGDLTGEHLPLDGWLAERETLGDLVGHKNGDRYKQFTLTEHGIKVDLFLVRPPAQWGVIFTLRTGPADYSRWLVTRQPWGALPHGYSVHDGSLYHDGVLIPTPEETDFFLKINIPFTPPPLRRPPAPPR